MLQEQYRALMQYSIPKEGERANKCATDWHCVKVSSESRYKLTF